MFTTYQTSFQNITARTETFAEDSGTIAGIVCAPEGSRSRSEY